MTRTAVSLLVAALVLAVPSVSGAQMVQLGEVMVFHVPDLKPDADLKAMEAYVTGLAPKWSKAAPATTLKLVKKDRVPHPGQYNLVWTTRTVANHKSIASTSGDFPFNPAILANAGDFREGLAKFVSGPGKYMEYQLVAPDKVGAA